MSTKNAEKDNEIVANSRVLGYGFQFAPKRVIEHSRTNTSIADGILLGLLIVKVENSGVRTISAAYSPLPEEKEYAVGETPKGPDISALLNAIMEQHPLGAERMIRKYSHVRWGRKIFVTELAPLSYYGKSERLVPDNTEATLISPEHTVPQPIPPTAHQPTLKAHLLADQLREKTE